MAEDKKDKMIGHFKNRFDCFIKNKTKNLSDENIKNIFNNYKENIIKEIENQMNTNIINIKENFVGQLKNNFGNNLLSLGEKFKNKNIEIIKDFSSGASSLFQNLKNNFKETTELIPKGDFNGFVNNFCNDNFSNIKGITKEKFSLNYDIKNIFENNIKNINNLLTNKNKEIYSFFDKFNFEGVFNKDIFDKLKNIKENTKILDEMKNNILENVNDNFNKIFDIGSIDFNFNQEQLLNKIYDSMKKTNPFNIEKIDSLKQNLNNGFGQILEKNLLEQPTNLLNLLNKNLNLNSDKIEFGGKQFSLNDCKKVSRILLSNGVIDKKGKFNENLFNGIKGGFEQYINLEIPSMDIPTEISNNVSSIDEIDFKGFSGDKKEIIINTIKNIGNSVNKSSLMDFKKELKSKISEIICKEIEKKIDDIFDFKKYF